jgi:hypothetical protein
MNGAPKGPIARFRLPIASLGRSTARRRSGRFLVGSVSDNAKCLIRKGHCKAFASSHGAPIKTSRSPNVISITRIGMDGFEDRIGRRSQMPINKMGTGTGFDFSRAIAG